MPAPTAKPLDQENIILVEMRPHPALVSGEAHHHIVNAPIGDEAERRDEVSDGGHMLVNRLHEQSPMAFAKFGQALFALWPLLHFPSASWLTNQARFHLFRTRQSSQLVRLKRVLPMGPRVADQQWLFLPMRVQEMIDVEILKIHRPSLCISAAKCKPW